MPCTLTLAPALTLTLSLTLTLTLTLTLALALTPTRCLPKWRKGERYLAVCKRGALQYVVVRYISPTSPL